MNFELIRNVVAAFYSDHEMIVIEAFLGHYADGDESIAVDEDKLNEIVNIKARTLRAALGKLQKGQLLYTQMTQREGERYAIRRWVLEFAEFERVVRVRLNDVRNKLTTEVPEAAAHCENCNRPVAVEELEVGFRCIDCDSALVEPPPQTKSMVTAEDLTCLNDIEKCLDKGKQRGGKN